MKTRVLLLIGLAIIASCTAKASSKIEITQLVTPAFVQQGVEFPLSVYVKNSGNEASAITVRCLEMNKQLSTESINIASEKIVPVRMKCKIPENGIHSINVEVITGKSSVSKSATLPVVAKKIYFAWFSTGKPEDKVLKYANVLLAQTPESREYWEERGVTHCMWKGGNLEIANMKSGSEYADYLAKDVHENGSKGILIDEIGDYAWNLDANGIAQIGIPGLMEFKKKNPDLFLGVWGSGSVRPAMLMATQNAYRPNGVDLLMMECYVNFLEGAFNTYTRWPYFDQRINMAREFDVLDHCVITLGTIGPAEKPKVSPSDIEDQVRYIRKTAPEMPGIGFFLFTPDVMETSLFADSLCYKYWILPVVTSWDRDIVFSNPDPDAGETIKIFGTIYNIGGMDAKNVKVVFYDGHPNAGGETIGKPIVLAKLAAADGYPKGSRKVSVDWKPSRGFHDVYMAVYANRGVTILDNLLMKSIGVR